MLKYVDESVVFEEIPDMVSLAVSISGCPYNCSGCHSDYLRQDIGTELTTDEIDRLIARNSGINCFLFMGDAGKFDEISKLARHIRKTHPDLKIAVYSGSDTMPDQYKTGFDYVKTGGYMEDAGPLNSETTNQRLYINSDTGLIDITNQFWNRK